MNRSFYKPPQLLAAMLLWLSASTAQAVMVDPTGRGEVLLLPYYTVNAGQQTLISLVNYSSSGKALKIRFREARNGRVVSSFNLYLGEFDVWTAALFSTAVLSEANLLTNDNSCTVPAIKESRTLPGLADGKRYLPFSRSEFSGLRSDGGPTIAARTREGFVEIIEMGSLIEGSPADLAASALDGKPSCTLLYSAWDPGGYWFEQSEKDLQPPSGQLSASSSIIAVSGGDLYSVPATALSRFSVVVQHTAPGEALPDLSSAVTESAREKVESTVVTDGKVYRSEWPQARAIDAVSAALMRSHLHNEYLVDNSIRAKSEWIVTFPTKYAHVDMDSDPAAAPPFAPWPQTGPSNGLSCNIIFSDDIQRRNREGRVAGEIIQIGGYPDPRFYLCAASMAIAFNDASSHFGAGIAERIPTSFFGVEVAAGFVDLDFSGSFQTRPALGGERYLGLPVIGFWGWRYQNSAARPGELGIYSGALGHSGSAECRRGDLPCEPL